MATSGIGNPAFCANRPTVSSSQNSVELAGDSTTRAPVLHLAMVFDNHSEMNAPPKPMISAKKSSRPKSRPPLVKNLFAPVSVLTMPSTSTIARLVAMSSMIRFMNLSRCCQHALLAETADQTR